MPTVETAAREALTLLRAKADPERARVAQTFSKEPVKVFGVAAGEVRAIASGLYAKVKADWTVEDAVALCDRLFPRPELEAKAIAALLLQRFRRQFPVSLFARSHAWLCAGFLDNWASVDGFCPEVVGALLTAHPKLLEGLETWASSPNRWVRRASIVSLIKVARKGAFARAVYSMARRHFASEDDLIHKATGWLLREVGKQDAQTLERFLLRHGPGMPRKTLRYAIERFPKAQRAELLERTRPKRPRRGFGKRA
jgi:3-methyladenine DNA glycosylase AlkD